MYRIGQATDIHQLVKNRPLVIGGVEIPFEFGLLGHSDADVLTHVIIDAIIGALGLGDIGSHFPDTDLKYKNISSLKLLEATFLLLEQANYQVNNLDCTVLLEEPLLAPYIPKMRQVIATILKTDPSLINIKATRGEKLGFVGRQEGIVAQAIVLLERKSNEKS